MIRHARQFLRELTTRNPDPIAEIARLLSLLGLALFLYCTAGIAYNALF